MCELFNKLNEPFPYADYEYDKENDRVYVNGQAVAERLNNVLGVGYWCYEPVEGSVKVGERSGYNNKVIKMVTLLINFQFYNKELKQWIKFTDAGSQDLNIKMTEGDATKSSITDGMKKCASRIGVASDLYKGLIRSKKDNSHHDGGYAILPESYKPFYESKGWAWPTYNSKLQQPPRQPQQQQGEPPQQQHGEPPQQQHGEPPQQINKITAPQAKMLFAISKGNNDLVKQVISEYGYTNTTDIPKADYNNICSKIEFLAAQQQAS